MPGRFVLHSLLLVCLLPLARGAAVAQPALSQSQLLQDGLRLLEARGDAQSALSRFEQAARGPDRAVAARARLYAGVAAERLGEERARAEYERVLRDFADQADVVAEARRRLNLLVSRMRQSSASMTLRRSMARLPGDINLLASMTPDGKRLPYLADDGRVGVIDVTTGAALAHRTLRGAGNLPGAVALSPDGRRVIVAYEQADGGVLVAIEGQGSTVRLLEGERGATVGRLTWPRADTVMCELGLADGGTAALLFDVPTRAIRTRLTLPALTGRLALSPDGRWLAYDAPTPSGPDGVQLSDVATGASSAIIPDAVQPAWTTDGRYLLFLSARTGTTSLWAQAISDGRPSGEASLIAHDLGLVADVLGVTLDGYHYLRQVGLVDVFTVPIDGNGQLSGPPAGAPGTFVGSNMGPSFSPDGRTLAFLTEVGFRRTEAIGLRDVVSGTYRVLPTSMRYIRLPKWSPDGTRLLVKGRNASGQYGFHIVDVRTADVTRVVTVPPRAETDVGAARWASDGRGILYTATQGDAMVLRRKDLASGEERPVGLLQVAGNGRFETAADGSMVYIEKQPNGGIVVVLDARGVRHEVFRFTSDEPVDGASFWPDGRRLLLERPQRRPGGGYGPNTSLWVLDEWGGAARPLGVEMPRLRMASVSPDGTRIAFTAGSPLQEPWVLEHFQSRLPGRAAGVQKAAR